eukprot:6764817-Pyramimonas_sp.AAC.1
MQHATWMRRRRRRRRKKEKEEAWGLGSGWRVAPKRSGPELADRCTHPRTVRRPWRLDAR